MDFNTRLMWSSAQSLLAASWSTAWVTQTLPYLKNSVFAFPTF